ncbi:50S ribosomal protein HLP, mitochondrial-like protein [Tanacetum coccineum]
MTHKVQPGIVQSVYVPVIHSTGVNTSTRACGSQPRSNTKQNRILPAKSMNNKTVEDNPRTNKSVWTKVNRVVLVNKGKRLGKPKGKLSDNSLNKTKPNLETKKAICLDKQLKRTKQLESIWQQIKTFIQMRSNLKVVDNSGAKRVICIQALKVKKGARLGDTIVASVKEAQPGGKVKGHVVYGVVVRAAMQKGWCDGSEVNFDDNAVVLVNKQGEPIWTRVFGPVPHELRKKKQVKILSLAQHIA